MATVEVCAINVITEPSYALSLFGVAGILQTLSIGLHNDQAIRNDLDDVVKQAVEYAETFGKTWKENTEQLDIQGELLKQAKDPEEVNTKVLEEKLNQTRTSFVSTRFGIWELQIKVHNLIEDCRRQVNRHKEETDQSEIKIGTNQHEIKDLREKIKLNEEDAESLDSDAKTLVNYAEELKRIAEKKRRRRRWFRILSPFMAIIGGPVLKVVAVGLAIGANHNDPSKCEEEARSCRDSANAKRSTAKSLTDDVTRMNSDIYGLENKIISLKKGIGVLEDAIRALEDVKKMLLSSVTAFDNVVAAIQDKETVLKETFLARSGFVTSLNARECSMREGQLENLKSSWARAQEAMESNRRCLT